VSSTDVPEESSIRRSVQQLKNSVGQAEVSYSTSKKHDTVQSVMCTVNTCIFVPYHQSCCL